MKKNYLLRPVYGKIGWGMLFAGALFLVLWLVEIIPEFETPAFSIIPSQGLESEGSHWHFLTSTAWNDEIGTIAIMIGMLLIAFSAEKDEDEFTDALRLRSWFLAGISYGVTYIVVDLLIFDLTYVYYMWFVQGGLLLLIYIAIFKTKLYLQRRACNGQ